MTKELTSKEIEKRFEEINAREPEEPTKEDLEAFAKADLESAKDEITLEECKNK